MHAFIGGVRAVRRGLSVWQRAVRFDGHGSPLTDPRPAAAAAAAKSSSTTRNR